MHTETKTLASNRDINLFAREYEIWEKVDRKDKAIQIPKEIEILIFRLTSNLLEIYKRMKKNKKADREESIKLLLFTLGQFLMDIHIENNRIFETLDIETFKKAFLRQLQRDSKFK